MATQQQVPASASTRATTGLLDRIVEQQAEVAARYKPVMSVQDLIEREKAIQYLVDNVMVEGVDFGWIPGTRPKDAAKPGEYKAKPTLFKAGAERACSFFGYAPKFVPQEVVEQWTPEQYGEPLFYYRYECNLAKDGHAVGSGIGSATTWESKYRYRKGERECPDCGKSGTIIKGKAEYGGGWLCFGKKGGCGAKFADGDERIESQVVEQIANPDVADVINTVQKMAQKRAYVAATLTATGLSGRFTQDLEDMPAPAPKQVEQPKAESAPAKRTVRTQPTEPGAEPRRVPKELAQVFANLEKDLARTTADAYPRLEGMLLHKGGDAGMEAYNRVLDAFTSKYPNGTGSVQAHKDCLRDLWDALQTVVPKEKQEVK